MDHFRPTSLSDLFGVFHRLDQGESLALCPAKERHSENAKGTQLEILQGSEVRLGVWTSGSTGVPKLVWKSWEKLKSDVRSNAQFSGWNWCSPFEPTSFAGVHVALQAWRNRGNVHSLFNDWAASWKTLAETKSEALSCTPTFLDLLIQFEGADPTAWSPQQITLGGEVLRPVLAERARRRFPDSRFTVIYAAAEFGVLAKTHRLDGTYEIESLNKHGGTWRASDGVLEVLRDGEWHTTNDRIEIDENSFRVLGRADSIANVAGAKVSLCEIGQVAEEVSGVRRAVAFAEPNSIAGQIVVLKFAVDAGSEPRDVESRLQRHLRNRLRKEAWPRRWVLDEVGLGSNSKGVIH